MQRQPRNIRHLVTGDASAKVIEWASPKQEEAFKYGPYPLLISGGFAAAKTWALCLKALYLSDTYPNNRGLIARKVAKELERTTQATFFKICPPAAYDPDLGGRRADSENYLRLARSGSEILWMHLDDPDIEGVIRGLEINWFILDQAEEIAEEVYDTLCARLGRWDACRVPHSVMLADTGKATIKEAIEAWPWKSPQGNPLPPTYPMLTCNPDVETHWLYRRFHPDSAEWQENYSKLHYKMIFMSPRENKFLPASVLVEMQNKDSSFVRRFVEGKWGIPEGQIHDIREASIIPGTPELVEYLKSRCTLHRTLDHGDASPTCCIWWAVDREGNIFAYREYYKPNALVSEHRKNITHFSEGERYQTNLADPSMFYKTMQKYGGRYSFADDYSDRKMEHGFCPWDAIDWLPADNDEMGTRNLINELLRPQGTGEFERDGSEKQRINPINGQLGLWPRLFFIARSESWPRGCHEIIRQTRSQRHERMGTELGRPIFSDERDSKLPDHAYDPLRYFVASRVALPVKQTLMYPKKSFGGVRDEMLRARRYLQAVRHGA